jgi:hypothetical protein
MGTVLGGSLYKAPDSNLAVRTILKSQFYAHARTHIITALSFLRCPTYGLLRSVELDGQRKAIDNNVLLSSEDKCHESGR